jgi:hypothetical protein
VLTLLSLEEEHSIVYDWKYRGYAGKDKVDVLCENIGKGDNER